MNVLWKDDNDTYYPTITSVSESPSSLSPVSALPSLAVSAPDSPLSSFIHRRRPPTRQEDAIDLADGRLFTAMAWSELMGLQSVGDMLQEHGADMVGLPPVLSYSSDSHIRDEDTIKAMRDTGLQAEECRDAGCTVAELTKLCHVPWGDVERLPDWGPYVGRAVIAEGKFGQITQIHPNRCFTIKVKYDDGSGKNDVGAKFLDTLVAGRGAVRLLEWASTSCTQ